MSGKSLPTIALSLFCVVLGFGQQNEATKEKVEKPCTETQILTERISEAQKKREFEFSGIYGKPELLKNFLPPGTDVWVVEIVTTGGFSGNGLPTMTLTSKGDLFVALHGVSADNQILPTENRKLKTEVLQKISQIVNTPTLTEKAKIAAVANQPAQNEVAFVCNDCYQTTITIVRRDSNGEIRYFSNREKNLLFSTGDFNRIHQIITEHIAEQN